MRACGAIAIAVTVVELVGIAGIPARADDPRAAHIRIDAAQRLQRIDGFGSGAFGGFTLFERGYCDSEFPRGVTYQTTPAQRQAMITTAVRELGVTHLRMWLSPSGIEPVNDNDDPAVINWDAFTWEGNTNKPLSDTPGANRQYGLKEWGDLLPLAVALGATNWIITPGRLPDWLKKKMNDPNDPTRFEEYAEHAAVHVLYLKKTLGLEAPYWSMMNEPDNMRYNSPDFWIPWVRATGRRFRKEGLSTRIMLPDYMNVHKAVDLTKAILADDEARSYVGALAYHHYRSSFDDPQPFLKVTADPRTADEGKLYEQLTTGARSMAELGRQYNLPSWETETAYYPRPLKEKHLSPWDVARGRANEIYYELVSGASAVAGMLMIWVDAIDPRYNYTVRMSGNHIVMTTDGTKVTQWAVTRDCGAMFGHYGRYVRPGDQRVGAGCEDRLIRVTAFARQKDQGCVAVVVNNATEPRKLIFQLRGLTWKPTFAGALLSDETHTLVSHPVRLVTGEQDAYESTVGPLSVCTFVWSQQDMGNLTLPAEVIFK